MHSRAKIREDLEKKVIDFIQNTPEAWDELKLPVSTDPVVDDSGTNISGKSSEPYMKRRDALDWYVKHKNDWRIKLQAWKELELEQAYKLHDKLEKHEKSYQHLVKCKEILAELSKNLELHALLMRRSSYPEKRENEAAGVLLYYNDESLKN